MTHEYQLHINGEFLEIFRSTTVHRSEIGLIQEIATTPEKLRRYLAEDITTMLFGKFDSINHRSETWSDNLKTLLAHDFDIFHVNGNKILTKSFCPLTFRLFCERTQSYLHFGHFHREPDQIVTDQFVKFCQVTGYPPRVHQWVISEILFNGGGGRLFAIDASIEIVLAMRDPRTGIVSGVDEILDFIAGPVAW
jgi:hypothetical protein